MAPGTSSRSAPTAHDRAPRSPGGVALGHRQGVDRHPPQRPPLVRLAAAVVPRAVRPCSTRSWLFAADRRARGRESMPLTRPPWWCARARCSTPRWPPSTATPADARALRAMVGDAAYREWFRIEAFADASDVFVERGGREPRRHTPRGSRTVDSRRHRAVHGDDRRPQPAALRRRAAAASRFGGIIVQGGVTSGLLNAVVAEDLPGPGSVFLHADWSFKAPVRPGDTMTAEVEVLDGATTSRSPSSARRSPTSTARWSSTAPPWSGPSPCPDPSEC